MRLNLYTVNIDYCKVLKEYDSRVPMIDGKKIGRPFIGVLICVSNKNYFAPLTSPKKKHLSMKDSQDFLKIKEGEWGAINLNNMIPIPRKELEKIDINNIKDKDYRNLLINQITWCNGNKEKITKRAVSLYKNMKYGNVTEKLKNRCCDFLLLEKVCYGYMVDNSLREEEIIYKYA